MLAGWSSLRSVVWGLLFWLLSYIDTSAALSIQEMPNRAIILEIVSDRLFTYLRTLAKWLAVVAAIGKILPDVRR
jgi:hypothetical protein